MLIPYQCAILTLDEAEALMNFIERIVATKTNPLNYDKMGKMGILPIYEKLKAFTDEVATYERVKNKAVDEGW